MGADPPKTCHSVGAEGHDVAFVSCAGTDYSSLGYHRSRSSTKHEKALWAVSRSDECHVFCTSETEGAVDANGDAWAVSPDATVELGTSGQRMAFFAHPTNPATDPWHGYPVSARRRCADRRPPPDDVVEFWFAEGRISYTVQQRILTGRL